MLNFFTRTAEPQDGTVYRFKEPSLDRPAPRRAAREEPAPAHRETVPGVMPTNYGDIVAFFRRTVAERKSPYNQLCRAADQLKDYIPDEISRLKVAWKVLGEQVNPEALALAISTHLADIDLARQKAARYTPDLVAAETVRLEKEVEAAQARRQQLGRELADMQARVQALQSQCEQQDRELDALTRELTSLQSSANNAAFLDQAAENEKNDLLARKALLGLE